MTPLGSQDDRLRRLRTRLTHELLAEEQEIERLERAIRDLRARHNQLQEIFEEELSAVGLAAGSGATPGTAPASRPATDSKPAGDSRDEKVLADARRFARLLVSEIALYNPLQIEEGRRHRDLYERLKSSIDRSRHAYDQRFANTAAQRFNFFYDELVRTLAVNDPSLLGSGYSGPSA